MDSFAVFASSSTPDIQQTRALIESTSQGTAGLDALKAFCQGSFRKLQLVGDPDEYFGYGAQQPATQLRTAMKEARLKMPVKTGQYGTPNYSADEEALTFIDKKLSDLSVDARTVARSAPPENVPMLRLLDWFESGKAAALVKAYDRYSQTGTTQTGEILDSATFEKNIAWLQESVHRALKGEALNEPDVKNMQILSQTMDQMLDSVSLPKERDEATGLRIGELFKAGKEQAEVIGNYFAAMRIKAGGMQWP